LKALIETTSALRHFHSSRANDLCRRAVASLRDSEHSTMYRTLQTRFHFRVDGSNAQHAIRAPMLAEIRKRNTGLWGAALIVAYEPLLGATLLDMRHYSP